MDLDTFAAQTWEYTAFKDWMAKNKNKTIEMYVETQHLKPAVKTSGKVIPPAWVQDESTIHYRGSHFRVVIPTE